MGLLDDAIREHLDLKRRRGADPAEVARAEQEALAPARRDAEEVAPALEAPAEEPAPQAPEPPLLEQQELEPPAPPPDPRDSDIVHQPTTEFHVEEEHEDEELEAAQPALDPPPVEPRPGTADEDVLEETPDFLQETPEHDRLWFEQRPPRDFDFDG